MALTARIFIKEHDLRDTFVLGFHHVPSWKIASKQLSSPVAPALVLDPVSVVFIRAMSASVPNWNCIFGGGLDQKNTVKWRKHIKIWKFSEEYLEETGRCKPGKRGCLPGKAPQIHMIFNVQRRVAGEQTILQQTHVVVSSFIVLSISLSLHVHLQHRNMYIYIIFKYNYICSNYLCIYICTEVYTIHM